MAFRRCTWREILGTCVFQSDFGFVLNCAFRKSGLFRVRNLGGVKGYVGLGFSVGDELGFSQSLSNLEAAKRRSVQTNRVGSSSYINSATNRDEVRQHAQNTRQVVPPFKPLPAGATRPIAQQPERQKLVVQQNSTALRTVPAPSLSATQQQDLLRQQQLMHQEAKQKQQLKLQQEAFALQVLKQQRLQQQEAMRQQQLQKIQKQQQMMVQQQMVAQKRHQQIVPMQVKRDQVIVYSFSPVLFFIILSLCIKIL
ncbi:hypothetical protein K0M31_012246 [Melipona bicolor]|uniref:Uncharacterized protein n=1 Tax=Melipona bicolor TaxID=60889 RepID=A0AA40KHN5_9HYME|nr:hypothetical protein K0M31_012246 [Melipona bicolor]